MMKRRGSCAPPLNSTMKMTTQDLSSILNVLGFTSELSEDVQVSEEDAYEECKISDDEFLQESNER